MTDFSGSRKGRWARVLLILVLPAGVLVARVVHQAEDDRLPSPVVMVSIVVGLIVAIAFALLPAGWLVEANGRRQRARVVALWSATPGLARYLDARERFLGDLSDVPSRGGAFLADEQGIRLAGYTRSGGASWSWGQVHDLALGPAHAITGLTHQALLVSVESAEGVDIVPVMVNPSIYLMRASARARARLLADLLALRREASATGEVDSVRT